MRQAWNRLPESTYEQVRHLCSTTHMTRTEVAEKLGISVPVVCRIAKAAGFKASMGPRRDPNLAHNFFDTIDSEAKSYWLGFISADGCIVEPLRANSHTIQIALQQRDAPHLRAFLDTVNPMGNVHYTSAGDKHYGHVTVYSDQLAAALMSHGVTPRKSLTLEPWDGPPELMRHYWRGMVDGDGCICLGKIPSLTLCGTEAVVRAFASFGRSITTSLATARRSRGDNWVVLFGTANAQDVAHHLYRDATIALARKRESYEALMSRTFRRPRCSPWVKRKAATA